MEFGIFTVGDVTTDPTTGRTVTEHERIKNTVAIAQEGGGGRSRRRRRRPAPQPAVRGQRSHHDDGLHRCADRADQALHQHHADHHDRPGADRGGLRDAPAPARRPDGPDARPRQHRPGLPVVRQGHPRRASRSRSRTTPCCAGSGARRTSTGRASSARRSRASPPRPVRSTASRRSSGTARSAAPRSPSRRRTTATGSSPTTSSGRPRTPRGWSTSTASASSTTATARPRTRSSGSAGRSTWPATARTPSASSARTSTTPRSTATARRWRSSPARPR